jgi:hypothetical protein
MNTRDQHALTGASAIGKARRGGKLGPLVEIPCTAALCRMLNCMERVSPLNPVGRAR